MTEWLLAIAQWLAWFILILFDYLIVLKAWAD
jgi:hypothetical protein